MQLQAEVVRWRWLALTELVVIAALVLAMAARAMERSGL